MGLIDSTNRIERALLTAKQEKAQERAEKKRDKAIKDRDKLDVSISKELMQEALQEEIKAIYNRTDYNTATLFFKSIQSKELILQKIASNELEYKVASGLYDKTLSSIDKIYKRNKEYLANSPPSQSERQKQACHDMAQALAGVVLALLKVAGRVILLVFLVVGGFCHLANAPYKRSKRRYR